jgi:DNA-binding MarR family transcriptional regulator
MIMTNNDTKILNDLLVTIFNTILKIEDAHLRDPHEDNLSMTEVHTLEAIGLNRKKTMTEIANELMISVGTLTICIARLVEKGYVIRLKSLEDKRIVRISLSEKGEKILVKHEDFHNKMVEQVVKGLDEDETKALIKSMENLKRFFKKKHQELGKVKNEEL